ncbi:MAG: hypothetical protein ACFFAU_21110 [Candidatus Hodarchaeota archaeon]
MKIKLVRPNKETLEELFCEHELKDIFAEEPECKFCGKKFKRPKSGD